MGATRWASTNSVFLKTSIHSDKFSPGSIEQAETPFGPSSCSFMRLTNANEAPGW